MLQKRLSWIVGGLFGLVGVAALAGGLSYTLFGEPDPQTASRGAIVRYLATSDLGKLPPARIDAFVDRLASELRSGEGFAASGKPNAAQHRTLQSNIEILKARWFVSRANRLAELAGEARTEYLDEQIATLLAWSKIDAAIGDASPSNSSEGTSAFFDDIERWIQEETNFEQQARMKTAVNDGIVRWLSTYDLAEQPPAVRHELATVIAGALNGGRSASAAALSPSPVEQTRLRENGKLLLEAWLLAQAELYGKLPSAERASFIDARIDEVSRWRIAELFSDNSSPSPASPLAGIQQLGKQIDVWINRAAPQQQAELRLLASDVQARLLQRALQAMFQR